LRVAVLKHSHHSILGDEAKDTGRFRQAGATLVALATPNILQITRVTPSEPPLEGVLQTLGQDADLILVEGYKSGPLPKVAVLSTQHEDQFPDYPHLIALVSSKSWETSLPVFQPGEVSRLGQFLMKHLHLS